MEEGEVWRGEASRPFTLDVLRRSKGEEGEYRRIERTKKERGKRRRGVRTGAEAGTRE